MTAQTVVRANGYLSPEELEIMYADGFPNLHETSPRKINLIYPPRENLSPTGYNTARSVSRWSGRSGTRSTWWTLAASRSDTSTYTSSTSTDVGKAWRRTPLLRWTQGPQDLDGFESYFMELMGKPPEFALGVASQSTSRVDLEPNLETYAYIGVPEYWLIDFTGGIYYGFPLRGLKLVDGGYVQIDLDALPNGGLRGRSEVLGIDFEWTGSTLRLRDPATDNWIQTPMENVTSLAVEPTRAEIYLAQALAEAEARADAAEAENAELRERLGRLREAGRVEE